jgi:hypothetical protein
MTTQRGEVDERLELVYQEAVRGLTHQQGVVESMNGRAGSLIFATSFAASLLGGNALADGVAGWDWLAMALLLAIGGLIAFLLWPYHNYRFRFDPQELLDRYVDTGATMAAIHRELAVRIKHDLASNWRVIQRLRIALQLSLVLLLFEILAWLLAIARVPFRLG